MLCSHNVLALVASSNQMKTMDEITNQRSIGIPKITSMANCASKDASVAAEARLEQKATAGTRHNSCIGEQSCLGSHLKPSPSLRPQQSEEKKQFKNHKLYSVNERHGFWKEGPTQLCHIASKSIGVKSRSVNQGTTRWYSSDTLPLNGHWPRERPFLEALDFPKYLFANLSSRYDDQVGRGARNWSKYLQVQMETSSFHPHNLISFIFFYHCSNWHMTSTASMLGLYLLHDEAGRFQAKLKDCATGEVMAYVQEGASLYKIL